MLGIELLVTLGGCKPDGRELVLSKVMAEGGWALTLALDVEQQ